MKNKYKTLYDLRQARKKRKALRYKDHLNGLENEIKDMGFKEMSMECYRVVHNPASDENFLPQKFKPGRIDRPPVIPAEEWSKFDSKAKRKHISDCSLSHFMTEEACRKMMNDRFMKDVERMGEQKATIRKNNLGTHIVKMKYKKDDGLWGNQDKEHIEFLPYEDLDFQKRIDNEFGYKMI